MRLFKQKSVALTLSIAMAFSSAFIANGASVSGAITAPTGVTLSAAKKNVANAILRWGTVSGASSYNVYQSDSRFGEYSLSKSNVTSTTITAPDSSKYYKVTAVDAQGKESSMSDETSYEIEKFGFNTYVFEEGDNNASVQAKTDEIFKKQEANQFGTERYSLLFKPGTYDDSLKVKIGFYTQVAGLGVSPEETSIGNIDVPAEWMKGRRYDGAVNYSALCNFWRTCENLTTTSKNTRWAVSQATALRRMNIKGNLALHHFGGYASGGFLADTKVAGKVDGGSQQQWMTRNATILGNVINNNYNPSWNGVAWNNVLVGCVNGEGKVVPGTEATWPYTSHTNVEKAPEIAEKPMLIYDDVKEEYGVFVPSVVKNRKGVSWEDVNEGEVLPIDDFFIAKPTDSADTINSQLASGKNLLLTPGIYNVDEPIVVNNPNTVVLGLGLATICPTKGTEAMKTADVGGIRIAGILFDAGINESNSLLTVGNKGNTVDNSDNPIVLSDTFYRVGGANKLATKTKACLYINSNNVIGDNFWIWRADHGAGVGWKVNTCDNGIIVNGNHVTAYALMVEHFQKYQTIWNGEHGKVYMYQSELPYDIPSQNVWNAPGKYGYADYKVANTVKNHEAYGVGIYSCYQKATCYLTSAIECPDTAFVKFTNAMTHSLVGNGSIDNVINNVGGLAWKTGEEGKVLSYCNKNAELPVKNPLMLKKAIYIASYNDVKSKYTYTGKAINPINTSKVSYSGIKLRPGVDFNIIHKNNTKIGKAKVTIAGTGVFREYETFSYKIVPGKVKISKAKKSKKKATIKFKKVKGAKKYEVVYGIGKSMKKKKTKITKKTSVKIKVAKNKKYFVKVRAFANVKKKKYYGSYSKKKAIK